MSYRLVLTTPFDIAVVTRKSYETKELAMDEKEHVYQEFPGFEVWTQEMVDDLKLRKVYVPEKGD